MVTTLIMVEHIVMFPIVKELYYTPETNQLYFNKKTFK